MEQNFKDQVKSVLSNGQTLTMQEKNSEIGMKQNYTSKYIESFKSIIRGEIYNPNYKIRNAVMTGNSVIDEQTCKILFRPYYVKFNLSCNTFC